MLLPGPWPHIYRASNLLQFVSTKPHISHLSLGLPPYSNCKWAAYLCRRKRKRNHLPRDTPSSRWAWSWYTKLPSQDTPSVNILNVVNDKAVIEVPPWRTSKIVAQFLQCNQAQQRLMHKRMSLSWTCYIPLIYHHVFHVDFFIKVLLFFHSKLSLDRFCRLNKDYYDKLLWIIYTVEVIPNDLHGRNS